MATYHVVLLVEQELSSQDARQVRSLHTEIEDPVHYTVITPAEDAAVRVQASMGAIGSGEVLAGPSAVPVEGVEELQKELATQDQSALDASVQRLVEAGADASGRLVTEDPIEALEATVAELTAAEAIILTEPHVVAEFFHVDWTSRARRKLGVPVLHLLERETFDEQGESFGTEGVTGF